MTTANSFPTRLKYILLFTTGLMIPLSLPSLVSGQGSTPARGFQPGASYALSDIETINTTNGNLMLNLALGKLAPGRGGLAGQLNLQYNSKSYDSRTQYYEDWEHPIGGQPQVITRNMLVTSDEGGWHYGTGYELQLIDRVSQYPPELQPQFPAQEAIYRWKVKVAFPDGSVREFLPRGFGNPIVEGYIDIRPDGWQTRWVSGAYTQDFPYLTNTLTYYTFDGSYMRLEVQHDSDSLWANNPWTLFFPDGTKVTNQGTRITDRNGNYVERSNITYNGHPATQLMDQLGRKIVLEYGGISDGDVIHFPGVSGVDLTYKVHWKGIQIFKTYSTAEIQHGQDPDGYPDILSQQFVVSRIELPAATGGLQYVFGYNAADSGSTPCCTPSYGWGELSSVTTPTGAQAQYEFQMDGQNGPGFGYMWTDVLKNSMTRKSLTYQQQYDGSSAPITETWNYSPTIVGGDGSIVMPDGGVVKQLNDAQRNYRTENADGSMSEKIWQANLPQGFPSIYVSDEATGINPYDAQRVNGSVKTEFTSIRDANGNFSKTAIKDFSYDKNGNATIVNEYDWVDYGSVPRGAGGLPTGIPASAVLKRRTTNIYANSTPDASDSSSNDADSYWNSNSPALKNTVSSTEVSNGSITVTRAEFVYDNPATTGNLTQQKSWDSSKGAYSNPLTAGNSISTSTQYNQYGSPTLTTDARGVQTQVVYGSVGGFTDLYPTQVKTAYQTAVQRTETREYDFSTGAVTRVTDVDNNVATATVYDVFGRPTLVKAAEGKSLETRTATEYSDVNRRVIVRSDLNTLGDGKLVSIQHYDQLGRIRLARQLEDAATQSATDETTGIKVQTRYLVSNPCQPASTPECLAANSAVLGSYQLASNPYRAATSSAAGSETTMGWARSRNDKGGRTIAVQTFAGSGLPGPWGANSSSTGIVTTAYDGNATTVADQAGKLRRSVTDGLGRLSRIDEPDAANNLGSTASPIQPTSYTYDSLSNLTTVTQGSQTRTFTYDSLSRLRTAVNPESGTISYQYDDNGNLLVKTDAREVSAHYEYDALNRATRRWYNRSTAIASTIHNSPALPAGVGTTDEVKFFYDSQALPAGAPSFARGSAMGRLVAQTYGTGSNGDYYGFDVLGRATLKIQQTGIVNYQLGAVYLLSGAMNTLTYPSGHTITNTFDQIGRLIGFSGKLGDGTTRTYSSGILYSPVGGLVKEQFGTTTPIYNKLFYNSRGQLAEIRESTSYTGPTDYSADRGAIVNNYSNQCTGICAGASMPDNNGNLLKQEIHIPGQTMRWQQYDYDSLNRLNWAREVLNGGAEQWKQQFTYDRWGNRTINTASTYGTGINNKAFTVNTANNRLGVPGGQSGTMTYDVAGNLTNDTYTGAGNRTYDGEDKITSAWGGNNQAQLYSYDASGQRIKRTVDGVTTWQIYGFGGELLAEYPANGATGNPQKEYGYRNGQLLITAAASGGGGGSTQNVTWTNLVGVSVNGNSLTKTAATNWGNAGASSTQSIASGDGYVEFTASETNSYRMVGLSYGDLNQSYQDIDFAAYLSLTNLCVYEGGVNRGCWGNFATGDTIRVAVESGVVKYKKNGAVFYTSNVAPSYPLLVDTALYSSASTINNVIISGSGASGGINIQWLVSDHLGTPRMILDQTGALANMKRHDYLPFGEELLAPAGGRTAAMGYAGGDGVRQQFTQQERDIETGLDYFGARYYASVQGRFTGADPIPVTKESFLNPQRWNLYIYVNNNPLGAVDPNGADGQGKAGDKVISVFLDFSLKDLGRRVTTDSVTKKVTKDVPNTTDWQGTASGAPGGYRVEVFGNPDVTGEKGLPQRVTDAAFNNALKNSEVVIYVGHGRGDPGTVPFVQQGIQAGNTLYTPTGTTGAIETAVLPVGTQVSATGAKPETQASVVANLSCNASRNGGAYFSFTGNNQVMVTVNSNWDGVTSFDALDKAANAFVKTYMNTGGNVQKAIDAANKVLQSIPGETKQNVGDRVEPTKVN